MVWLNKILRGISHLKSHFSKTIFNFKNHQGFTEIKLFQCTYKGFEIMTVYKQVNLIESELIS